MKLPFASKELSPVLRRRVDLAVAVAQERLLSTHVDCALDLIELAGDHVPFDNVLHIYTRLLRLNEDEARVITTRALAILGEHATDQEPWPERLAEGTDVGAHGEEEEAGFLGQLRQRLRGRVNDQLRQMVELKAACTEVAVLDTHVENALHFVDILEKDLPPTEAVELYLEVLDVRDSVAEVAYYIALSRLSEKLLPEPPAGRTRRPVVSLTRGATPRLRVVENRTSPAGQVSLTAEPAGSARGDGGA